MNLPFPMPSVWLYSMEIYISCLSGTLMWDHAFVSNRQQVIIKINSYYMFYCRLVIYDSFPWHLNLIMNTIIQANELEYMVWEMLVWVTRDKPCRDWYCLITLVPFMTNETGFRNVWAVQVCKSRHCLMSRFQCPPSCTTVIAITVVSFSTVIIGLHIPPGNLPSSRHSRTLSTSLTAANSVYCL